MVHKLLLEYIDRLNPVTPLLSTVRSQLHQPTKYNVVYFWGGWPGNTVAAFTAESVEASRQNAKSEWSSVWNFISQKKLNPVAAYE